MLFGSAPADATDKPSGAQTNEEIVIEANERWHVIKDFQSDSDERCRSDIKFANGDSRNAWQWPDKIYAQRTGDQADLPSLTINKTRVHNDIIINGMSKNSTGVKIRPVAGNASYKSAEVMMNLIRRINVQSKASAQFRKVAEQQVDGGIGYIILETRYVSNKTNAQDIYFYASRDPTGIYLDRWSTEIDGSDSGHGFIFDEMSRKEFNRKYPKWKDKVGSAPLHTEMAAWLSDKSITVVKYYRKRQSADLLVWYRENDTVPFQYKFRSEIVKESGREIFDALMDDIEEARTEGGSRPITNDKVEWFLIAGDTVIDKGDWPGKYIPICRCPGREIVIDRTLDRKGHTRPLIDAQRMLNYASSCSVEGIASQTKSHWLVPARAVEGQDTMWKDHNVKNYSVLLWNDVDYDAPQGMEAIAKPERIDPPKPSPGWLQIGQDAERHLMMVSGQWQAQLGENDQQSAASGKAINERQEQADTATYHFNEHMTDMKRFLGVQLLDLIPKVYDTERTLQIEDEMGQRSWIMINPDQQEAVRELQQLKEEGEAARIALNPAIGEYECISDPGPDYATQRQETFNAMVQILQANKELVAVIGDIFFKNSDFSAAEELRERMEREIKANKPYLFDKNIDPQVVALQQQYQQMLGLNSELQTKLAEMQLKVRGRDERRDIEAFKADTDRMRADSESLKWTVEALSKILLTPQQREQLDHEIAQSARDRFHEVELGAREHVYSMIQQANAPEVSNRNGAAK